MTDLEITKLCAKAMGLPQPIEIRNGAVYCGGFETRGFSGGLGRAGGLRWNPLHDDAQAMALVKKFHLCFFAMDEKFTFGLGEPWQCRGPNGSYALNKDLNRAICRCVAKMQAAK